MSLTDAEREALFCDCDRVVGDACPVHTDAMDLWTEKPAREIAAAVEQIAQARATAAVEAFRARAAQAIEDNVDWSSARNNYGDNAGYEHAARIVRDLT